MHLFFSGIGGSGANSIALLAKQAGYKVSGSDAQDSSTITYLKDHGVDDIYVGQNEKSISALHKAEPIDAFIYTSALPLTDPHHPELEFCRQNNIPALKHDEFLAGFIKQKGLKLVAVAGTHGKSTTAAMMLWLAKGLGLKAGWAVGAKMSFADTGHFEDGAQYFIYEADEFDRKFLSFYPHIAVISGLDWDHPDIYPTRESYYGAFTEFLQQSERASLWHDDAEKLGLTVGGHYLILDDKDPLVDQRIRLPGRVNRMDAWLAANTFSGLAQFPLDQCVEILNKFPGLSRRFEEIAPNIFSDYAHTPPKIRAALQTAEEVAGDNVVVVYEGLHNTRQHFIKDELAGLFDDVKKLYVVPSYLARENKDLKLLSPEDLINLLSDQSRSHAEAGRLDEALVQKIKAHADSGELILALSAGGGGSLDEWLRNNFS